MKSQNSNGPSAGFLSNFDEIVATLLLQPRIMTRLIRLTTRNMRDLIASSLERGMASWRRARAEGTTVCPHCGESQLRRSYVLWNWHERWRQLLPHRPYQCQTCAYVIWQRPPQRLGRRIGPAEMAFAMPETLLLRIDLNDLDASWESVASRNRRVARWHDSEVAFAPSRIHLA